MPRRRGAFTGAPIRPGVVAAGASWTQSIELARSVQTHRVRAVQGSDRHFNGSRRHTRGSSSVGTRGSAAELAFDGSIIVVMHVLVQVTEVRALQRGRGTSLVAVTQN